MILGCRQLRASWRAAIGNGSEISEYVVRVFDEATCEEERVMRIAAQLLDCTIEALEPDHAYKFVHVFNDCMVQFIPKKNERTALFEINRKQFT